MLLLECLNQPLVTRGYCRPARTEPKLFLSIEYQSGDNAVDNVMLAVPSNITTTEQRVARIMIEHEYPLLTVRVFETSDIDVPVIADNARRITTSGRMMITNCEQWIAHDNRSACGWWMLRVTILAK